jgi:hypothetical protein
MQFTHSFNRFKSLMNAQEETEKPETDPINETPSGKLTSKLNVLQ